MKLKLQKTKLQDEYARPIDFYHTTNVVEKIERFLPLSHFGTKKAADMRGIHFAYQMDGKIEPSLLPREIPERIKKHFNQLKTYQVHLYIKSPLKTVDFGKHNLPMYHQRFFSFYAPKSIYLTPQECRQKDSLGSEKFIYKKALSEFIFEHPFSQPIENLKKELECENLFSPATNDKSKLANNVVYQRMIRFLEMEGYDSFVYRNDCEDVGQKSYIIFRPEQVFQNGETEHELPKISPKHQAYLNQIETEFFKTKGIIPPHQRKELNRQIRNKTFFKTK